MEQWENLSEYVLKKVPALPGFTGKNGVWSTESYARIKAASRIRASLLSFHLLSFLHMTGF